MPGGDGSDRSGGQWRAETQPNGTGRTDRTGEGRSGRCGGYVGGSDGSDGGSDGSDGGSDQHSCAPSLPPSLLLPFLDASDPPFSRSCFLSNRTLCLRRTRRCPRRRLAHLRLRPTCIPLASSSLALDASFALGRPFASFLIWLPCAPSFFGCLHPFWMPSALLCPFSFFVAFRPGLSFLIWMPSALDPDSPSPPSLFGCFTSFALLDDASYLYAQLLSCSPLRSSGHLPYRVTFHIGSPSLTQILGSWPTQS